MICTMLERWRMAVDRRDFESLASSQAIQEKYPEEFDAGMACAGGMGFCCGPM